MLWMQIWYAMSSFNQFNKFYLGLHKKIVKIKGGWYRGSWLI